ncbi:MAG TPA: SRPBCC family protein [Terriglobales bacterium]|jgi:uncharacterized protein YndB with AHSA1/START domain
MNLELSIDIAAGPDRVWQVLADVERWPEWTPSMLSVKRLDSGPFRLGSEALIRQPRLPRVVWRVTEFEPGRSFTWEARSWGALTVASHRIIPQAGGLRVKLAVEQTGLLVPLFGPWISKVTRQYMSMEAQGLRQRCEALKRVA